MKTMEEIAFDEYVDLCLEDHENFQNGFEDARTAFNEKDEDKDPFDIAEHAFSNGFKSGESLCKEAILSEASGEVSVAYSDWCNGKTNGQQNIFLSNDAFFEGGFRSGLLSVRLSAMKELEEKDKQIEEWRKIYTARTNEVLDLRGKTHEFEQENAQLKMDLKTSIEGMEQYHSFNESTLLDTDWFEKEKSWAKDIRNRWFADNKEKAE